MNPELEALILAREAALLARAGAEADQLLEKYISLLDETLAHRPGLSREVLRRAVERAHARWMNAQKKTYPTIPPKA
ncbi:MAG: hypothetical protein EXS35_11095 [Pedosphaera sp.]|nr:hypothetical protein [Pedosphaera sp.]